MLDVEQSDGQRLCDGFSTGSGVEMHLSVYEYGWVMT